MVYPITCNTNSLGWTHFSSHISNFAHCFLVSYDNKTQLDLKNSLPLVESGWHEHLNRKQMENDCS